MAIVRSTVPPARFIATCAFAMLLVLAACASTPRQPLTPYAQMGGQPGIEGIVDDLLDKIVADDRINIQFVDVNLVRLREKLIEQLCVETGGPCTYTGDSMRVSHAGHRIDDAQFNALVEDLTAVMESRKVPIGAQNELIRRLARMHRDIVEP